MCACRSGYLRAKTDAVDTPCTSKCAEKIITFFRPVQCFASCALSLLLLPFGVIYPTPQSTFVSLVTQLSIQMRFFCDRLLGEGRAVEVASDGPQ